VKFYDELITGEVDKVTRAVVSRWAAHRLHKASQEEPITFSAITDGRKPL
jgi:hypothetical protein